MKIFSGTGNLPLAKAIACEAGILLGDMSITRFADGELFVVIPENVKGQDVFVVQSISAPANDHLVELLIILNTLKKGLPRRVTALIPYYGYGRQDKLTGAGRSTSAKLVADLLKTAGADYVLSADWHSTQIDNFFTVPALNLSLVPELISYIRQKNSGSSLVIVAPDAGGIRRAKEAAIFTGSEMVTLDKIRDSTTQTPLISLKENVEGKACVIIDDLVDSAGTLCEAVRVLHEAGATTVDACITHGIFSGDALARINDSPLRHLVITDTIQPVSKVLCHPKINIIPSASFFVQAIEKTSADLFFRD